MKQYVFLVVAIGCEIFATSQLKNSLGFTKILPSSFGILGFALSAMFLSFALKEIPIGIAYAVWASVGIVFTVLMGWLFYNQKLDVAALIGIVLILSGVVCVSLFSKSNAH
jgi:small multidrug resistance pump